MTLVKEATSLYKSEKLKVGLKEMIHAFVCSMIEFYYKLCPCAKILQGKGMLKKQTLIILRGTTPTFILFTSGSVNNAKVMDKIHVKPKSYYLIYKDSVAFGNFQKGANIITSAKENIVYEIIESRSVDKESCTLSDETIQLMVNYTSRMYPYSLRQVV